MHSEPAMPGEELAARLEELLKGAVSRRRQVRHGLLAVAAVDGSWMWQGADGIADPSGNVVTTATRFPIASVTKLYTASIVMGLNGGGTISLDDRLVDLLPAEITDGLHVIDGVDRTAEITVEQLLSHTSGLPDYFEEAPRGGRSAQERLLAGEDAPVPFEEVLRLVREDLKPHFPPQPLDAPKRKARYTDTNFQLLGAVIEEVTGNPLHQVFDETFFGPMSLGNTSSYPHQPRSGASPEPEASVWAKGQVLQPQGALRHQVPDGGIISTLGDQIRFLQGVIRGDFPHGQGVWSAMQQRFNRVFFPVDYGLGLMRYAPPRWMSPQFVPPVFGHTGSTATWLFHCPELNIVTAGTFDVAQPPLPFRFVPRVLNIVARTDF